MKYDISSATDFESAMRGIEKQLNFVVDDASEAATKAFTDVALDCLGRSIPRAPIESGDLRSSAFAKFNGVPFARGSKGEQGGGSSACEQIGTPAPAKSFTVTVGYGSIYALRQHEDLSYRHDRTDGYRRADGTTVNMVAGGQAKYLESVVLERKIAWRRYIIRMVKKSIKEEGTE